MRRPHRFIDPELAAEHVEYDPLTGAIRLLIATARLPVGHVFSTKYPNTYIRVSIAGVRYAAHRVAWVLMTGEQPNIVDHDNGIKHDNRWKNLNNGTHSDNSRNTVWHRAKRGIVQTTEPC